MDPDGMCVLMDFRDDGTTPYMLFFKDGIIEEKVVCALSACLPLPLPPLPSRTCFKDSGVFGKSSYHAKNVPYLLQTTVLARNGIYHTSYGL